MDDFDQRRVELALLVSAVSSFGFFLVAQRADPLLIRAARACLRSALMLGTLTIMLLLGAAIASGITHDDRHKELVVELFAIAISGSIFSLCVFGMVRVGAFMVGQKPVASATAPDDSGIRRAD